MSNEYNNKWHSHRIIDNKTKLLPKYGTMQWWKIIFIITPMSNSSYMHDVRYYSLFKSVCTESLNSIRKYINRKRCNEKPYKTANIVKSWTIFFVVRFLWNIYVNHTQLYNFRSFAYSVWNILLNEDLYGRTSRVWILLVSPCLKKKFK